MLGHYLLFPTIAALVGGGLEPWVRSMVAGVASGGFYLLLALLSLALLAACREQAADAWAAFCGAPVAEADRADRPRQGLDAAAILDASHQFLFIFLGFRTVKRLNAPFVVNICV